MGWYKVRLDPADIMFSRYIRKRDGKCVYPNCTRTGIADANGDEIKGLQASHFFSRKKESVRFDPENVDAVCPIHHKAWEGGNKNIDYIAFKKKQLGEKRFNLLEVRANSYKKKDRGMDLIIAKELYKSLSLEGYWICQKHSVEGIGKKWCSICHLKS